MRSSQDPRLFEAMAMKEAPDRQLPGNPAQRNERPSKSDARVTVNPDESDPQVERGERIETGKAIHRSGRDHGFVPGATEQTCSEQE